MIRDHLGYVFEHMEAQKPAPANPLLREILRSREGPQPQPLIC
jgi:hypothetical protein